jgi:hypothetical protein
MKTFDIRDRALASGGGEYILGLKDTGSHACYMIYGLLRAGEKQRLVKPGSGHEELVLSVKGEIKVTGHFTGTLKEGSAFHITGEGECFLENKSGDEAIYIVAGGHSEGGHH